MKSSLVSPSSRAASSRYRTSFLTAMGIYVLTVAAISGWFGWEPPKAGLVLYLAALSPAVPIGFSILSILRYLNEEPDEFLRMIRVKAVLIGFALTMFVCTAWGFLAQYAHVWPMPLYGVYPMWAFFMGLATPVVNLKYR
jgi:hypothetical protein